MAEHNGEDKSVDIRGVSKIFTLSAGDLPVLDKVDLHISSGEFISVVGSSGCGKSTFLRIISGLESATAGDVFIGGRKVDRPSVKTGVIFQESRLFPWLSVEQNIAFGIHKKVDKEGRKKLICQHVGLVGLAGFENAYPRQLSGGMRQRVSIARALINKPGVLLLDEPFGALDALTRIHMQNEVLRIWSAEKSTMVLVTHDVDEAIFLSDRIVVMSDRPGYIKNVLDVDISRPRDRSSVPFMEIRKKIYTHFFAESALSLEYYL
ncbi:MAG: ABC transporter ATP-binding protein [Synergistaceae bacterium]|jgi:sulfonate transport system ATP-binding protein|nr:ABC transporter ATP-binding protein [Synergistaceae bacterium]